MNCDTEVRRQTTRHFEVGSGKAVWDGEPVPTGPARSPSLLAAVRLISPPGGACTRLVSASTSKFAAWMLPPKLRWPNNKLPDDRLGEPSEAIRQQVEAARESQKTCFEGSGLTCNPDKGAAEVREFCGADGAGRSLPRPAMTQLDYSVRSYHRIPSHRSEQASSSLAPISYLLGAGHCQM